MQKQLEEQLDDLLTRFETLTTEKTKNTKYDFRVKKGYDNVEEDANYFDLESSRRAFRSKIEETKSPKKKCTYPGCDGSGNVNPLYATHKVLNTCPLYQRDRLNN